MDIAAAGITAAGIVEAAVSAVVAVGATDTLDIISGTRTKIRAVAVTVYRPARMHAA